MIFLSHNHLDKQIVEPIAIKLKSIYGQASVFYDSWSIQPGDGIIAKMNEGLEKCRFFFFFVSENSLRSNMVSLEWQNALYKATKKSIKFIPVRISDCMMPAILLQSVYIDFVNYGPDVAFRQINDVIQGNSVFRNNISVSSNICVATHRESINTIVVCFAARYYLDPISHFGIITDENPANIIVDCLSDGFSIGGFENGVEFTDGKKHNVIYRTGSRGIVPGFPLRLRLSLNQFRQLELIGFLHEIREHVFRSVPVVPLQEVGFDSNGKSIICS